MPRPRSLPDVHRVSPKFLEGFRRLQIFLDSFYIFLSGVIIRLYVFHFDTYCPVQELPGDVDFLSEVLLDSGKYLGESWQHCFKSETMQRCGRHDNMIFDDRT